MYTAADSYYCGIFLAPEISLERELYEVNETDFIYIGVELKSDLKRDIDIYLSVDERTAAGKI